MTMHDTTGAGVAAADSWWLMPDSVSLEERSGELVVVHRYSARPKTATAVNARRLLEDFLRLQVPDAARVGRFVLRHGALLLDWRGAPLRGYAHPPCEMLEPIGPYSKLACVLTAVLRVGERGRVRKAPDADDFNTISEYLRPISRPELNAQQWTILHSPIDHRSGRHLVIELIDWWFRVGDVRPGLFFAAGAWQAEWSGRLWGVLGSRLIQSLVRGQPVPVCAGCGSEVHHERQAKAGQKVWCERPDCLRHQNRLAQRKRRARGIR